MVETETPEEKEVFSAMEQSSVRKEGIRQMDKYQSIMEELALARMLIRELGDRLAKLEKPEKDNTYVYASSLATAIWQKHYIKESPKFALLDTTQGVLTQIDNMTCGLVREKPAQPEQEPVAWATKDDFYRELEREHKRIHEEMKIKSVTMRCKDYDIALPIIGTDFGRVLVGQVSTPPQRTWVGLTNEERKDLCRSWSSPMDAIYATEAKLKDKNERISP